MARGKRSITLDEQLEKMNDEIQKLEDKLKELRLKKKALESSIENQKLSDLYDIIIQSGKTIDEAKEIIEQSL